MRRTPAQPRSTSREGLERAARRYAREAVFPPPSFSSHVEREAHAADLCFRMLGGRYVVQEERTPSHVEAWDCAAYQLSDIESDDDLRQCVGNMISAIRARRASLRNRVRRSEWSGGFESSRRHLGMTHSWSIRAMLRNGLRFVPRSWRRCMAWATVFACVS